MSSFLVLAARKWHLVRWGVAGVAVLILVMSVTNARERATAAESRWTDVRTVWVASSDIEAGRLITDSEIRSTELPLAALPLDASISSPAGRRLRDDMAQGEVIRDGRLTEGVTSEAAALLDPHSRGITLQIEDGSVLVVGDRVDLLALIDGRPLAANAVVVATNGGGWAMFSVAESQVSAVVSEITVGGVVPVLVP